VWDLNPLPLLKTRNLLICFAPNTPKTLKASIGQRGIPNPKEGTEHTCCHCYRAPRALRILDALLFDMEGQGHFLKWPDKERSASQSRLTVREQGARSCHRIPILIVTV